MALVYAKCTNSDCEHVQVVSTAPGSTPYWCTKCGYPTKTVENLTHKELNKCETS